MDLRECFLEDVHWICGGFWRIKGIWVAAGWQGRALLAERIAWLEASRQPVLGGLGVEAGWVGRGSLLKEVAS